MTVTNMSPACGRARFSCVSPGRAPARHAATACEYLPVTGAPEGVDFVRVLGPVQVVLASGARRRSAQRQPATPARGPRAARPVRRCAPSGWPTRSTSHRARCARRCPGCGRCSASRTCRRPPRATASTSTSTRDAVLPRDRGRGRRDDEIGALERALARWAGPALEEFAGEEWAAGDAARLTELHASATEDLAAALIAASRWSDAVARLEAHIADVSAPRPAARPA